MAEAKAYDSYVYRVRHMKYLYIFIAIALISVPVGFYSHFKFRLSFLKYLFTISSMASVAVLSGYLLFSRAKLLFEGDALLFERIKFKRMKFVKDRDIVKPTDIKMAGIKNAYSGYQTITIDTVNDFSVYLPIKSSDAIPIIAWLNTNCKDKVIESKYSEKDSYKLALYIIGTIILDIVAIFIAIYLGT